MKGPNHSPPFYINQIRCQYIQFISHLKEACPGVELELVGHKRGGGE